MNLPQFAINRPVTILMIFLALILIGAISLMQLPVELYPNVSFGQISVILNIRGGIPPTEVEQYVTRPVEEALSTVSHLRKILSISKEGEATVVLYFEPGIDMDFAALEVREKFARIKNKLPKSVEKPVIAQFRQTDMPIIILAVTSGWRSTEEVRKIVDEKLKERLKRAEGVANVEVFGGRERKIMIDVDKHKLHGYGLNLNRVIDVLGLNNLNLLAGEVNVDKNKYLIRTIGEFDTVDEIRNLGIAATPSGSIVRIGDVAKVEDGYLDAKSFARLNMQDIVSIYVQKESTENTVKIAEAIKKELEDAKKILPSDINIVMTRDQSEFIEKAINNLKSSLLKGGILIILVLLITLRRFRLPVYIAIIAAVPLVLVCPSKLLYFVLGAAVLALLIVRRLRPLLIVTASIPISVIITFSLMKFKGLTINFMTLFGLILGVGMLVDNSIVVFENIVKKHEEGLDNKMAAIAGSKEVIVAIIASTITTIIVFLPMFFIKGETEILYSGVAWTVTFSLIVSLFVAVTLVPMLAARSKTVGAKEETANQKISLRIGFLSRLRFPNLSRPTRRLQHIMKMHAFVLIAALVGALVTTKTWYRRLVAVGLIYYVIVLVSALVCFSIKKGWHRMAVAFVLKRRYFILILIVALFTLSAFVIFTKLGMEFMGTTEQDKFTVFIELPPGVKINVNDDFVKKIEKLLERVPEIKRFSSRVEGWSSKIHVELIDIRKRKRSAQNIIDLLRPMTDRLKPAFIHYKEEQEVGTNEIILDVFGYDYDILRELAISCASRLKAVPGLTDIKIHTREGRPEMGIVVDKARSGLFAIDTDGIASQVHAQMRGLRATLFHTEGREVEVIGRLDKEHRNSFRDVHRLILYPPQRWVLVEQLSDFKFMLGPSEIWRKDRNRMVQVSANIGKIPLGQIADIVKTHLADVKFPENYFYRFGGDYPSLIKAAKQFNIVIALVLILVFLVLASFFESYIQPFIIMAAVPLALIGAGLALFITGKAVGMGVRIGMMMLAGIVVNNSIILVDHINHLHKTKGFSGFRAAIASSRDRIRPILMTTATTVLGLLPMAMDKSEGANLWSPLAITVIGGLMSSTILTIFIIPAIYVVFEDARRRFYGGRGVTT